MARDSILLRAEENSPKSLRPAQSGGSVVRLFKPASPGPAGLDRLISPAYLARAINRQQEAALYDLHLKLSGSGGIGVRQPKVGEFLQYARELVPYIYGASDSIPIVFGTNSKINLLFKGALDILPLLEITAKGYKFPIINLCGRTLWILPKEDSLTLDVGRYSVNTVSVFEDFKYSGIAASKMIDEFEHALAVIARRMNTTPEIVARRLARVDQENSQQPDISQHQATAALETKDQVREEEPRPRSIADAKAEALAIGDTTLLGQLNRLEERLASTELPATGLTSLEQAQAASRLRKTYRDAQARLLERNLEPLPEDGRVSDAGRLYMDFKRKNPELKEDTPRASPRRQHSAKTPSAA